MEHHSRKQLILLVTLRDHQKGSVSSLGECRRRTDASLSARAAAGIHSHLVPAIARLRLKETITSSRLKKERNSEGWGEGIRVQVKIITAYFFRLLLWVVFICNHRV